MLKYLKLIRIKHYIKNGFIFMPAFFAMVILDSQVLINLSIAFVSFSFIASCIYILNDIHDFEYDRLHPSKSKRPIASGLISIKRAHLIAIILFSISIVLSMLYVPEVMGLLLLYAFINVLYTFWLKSVAVVDIFVIAIGFVLRIFVGGVVAGVVLHPWIITMTFLLALFLGLGKRRDDVIANSETKVEYRSSIHGYTLPFVDNALMMLAGTTITAYLIYTLSPDIENKFNTQNLYFTSVFVILGILRYLQIIFVEKKSGSPTDVLLNDRVIQVTIIAWITLFWILLYGHN
jgi:decaprenyl-phosphate phosphoribosyltransferase